MLDEPGRRLLQHPDAKIGAPHELPFHCGPSPSYRRIPRRVECRPHPICVDEVRPSDSPKPQPYACAYLEHSTLAPGWMAQSAVVRDYRVLEVGRRRANRLVLTVAG